MTKKFRGKTFFYHSYRKLTQVISLGVAVSFLLPFLTWAFETPNYFASHPGMVQLSGKPLIIPATLGRITKVSSGSAKTIIHIEDLHCNYDVQMNIAKMIAYLAKTHHLSLVGEEGASYTINTAKLSSFPDYEARRDVADYLVRQGKLTGAEYGAAVGDVPIRLEGIETPALYKAAHEQVSAFFNHQSQGYCYDLKDMLDQLKPLVYNRALKALDKKTMAYREGRLELVSYADVLLRQARRYHLEPAHGLLLQELVNGKQGLDQDQVVNQLALLERRVREQLYTTAQQQELDQAYHRLDVIQKLLNISATPEELKDFRDHRQNFRVAAFLNFIQTTGGSTASSLTLDADLYHLDHYLDRVGRFYDLADQRSEAFVANLNNKMDRYHQSLAVMITGGFHTDKVLTELRRRGVTCISVKPRVTDQDVVNPYFALLQNQRLPLEKLLAQNQDILALPTECPDLNGVDGHQVVAQQSLSNRVRVAERFKELLLKARLLARLIKKNSTHWQEIPATMAAELKDYLANGTLTLAARQFLEDNVHLNNAGKPSLAVLPFQDGDRSISSMAILDPELMAGRTQHELQRLRLGQTNYLFYSDANRTLEALNALLKQQSQRPLYFLLPPGVHLKDFFGWPGVLVDLMIRVIRWFDEDKPRQPVLDRIKPWLHSLPKMELTWMAAAGSPWLMPVVLMTASNGEKGETKGTGQSTQAQDKEDLIETLTRTIRLYPKELIHSRDLKLDSWDSKNYHFEEMDSNTGWGHWVSNHFPDLVLGTWEDVEKKYSYTHQKMIRHVVERFRNRNGSVVSFYYFDDHAYSVPYAMEAVVRGEVPEKGNTQLFLDEHYDFADVPAMTRHFKVPQNLAEWLSNINQYIYMNNLNWIFSAAGFLKKHIWLYDTSSRNEPFRQSQETVKEEEKAVRDNRLKYVKSGFEHYFHYARRPRQQKIIVNIDTDVIGDMLGVGDVHYPARTRPYAALRYLSDFLRQLTLQDKNTVGTFHASTTFDQITYGDVEIVRFLARVAPVLLLLPKQENEQALTEAVHKVAEEHAPHVQVNLERGVLTESKQEPMLFNIIHSLLAALGSAGLVLIPLLMGAPHWLGLASWSMALVFALHGLTGHLIMGASMEKINTAWRNRIQRYFGPDVKIEYLNTAALHAKTEEFLTASAAASDKPAVLSWWQWGLIPWTSAVTDVASRTVYLHQGWVSDELGLGLKLLRLIMLPLTLVHEASALWLNDHLAVKAMPGWVQTVGRYMLRPLQMATLYPYWKLLIVKKRGLETASSAIDDKDLQTNKQDINAKIKAQLDAMYAAHTNWTLDLKHWQMREVATGPDQTITIHYMTIPNPLRPKDRQYDITLEALTEEGDFPNACKITTKDPFTNQILEATFQLTRRAGQKKISISHLSRPLQSGVGTGVMFFLSQAIGKEQEPGWTFQVDQMMFKPILTLMRTFFKQIKIHGASVANRDFETYLESEFYNKALSGSPKSPDEIVRDQLADLDTIEGAVLERLGWKEKTAEKRQLADQFAGIMQYKNESDAMGRKNFRNIALARVLAYFKMYYADHPEEKQEYVHEWVKLLNEQFKDLPRLVYYDLIGKLAEAAVGKAKNGNPFVDLNDLDFRIWSSRTRAFRQKLLSSTVIILIVISLVGLAAYSLEPVLKEHMIVQEILHHLVEWGSLLSTALAGTIKETSTTNNHPGAMGRFAVRSITILKPQGTTISSEELAALLGEEAPATKEGKVVSLPEIAVTGHMINRQGRAEPQQEIKCRVALRAILSAEKEKVAAIVEKLKLIVEHKREWFGDDKEVLKAMISQAETLLENKQTNPDLSSGLQGFYTMDKVTVVKGPKNAVFAGLGLEHAILLDKWLFDNPDVLEAALLHELGESLQDPRVGHVFLRGLGKKARLAKTGELSSENIGFVGRILGNNRQEQLTQWLARSRPAPPGKQTAYGNILTGDEKDALAALYPQKGESKKRKTKDTKKASEPSTKDNESKNRKTPSQTKGNKDHKADFQALSQKASLLTQVDLTDQSLGSVESNHSIRLRQPWLLRYLPGLRLLLLSWSALTIKAIGRSAGITTGQSTDLAQVLAPRLLQQWPQDHFSTMDLLRHGQQHKLIEIRRLPEEIKWWTYLNLLRQGQCWQNLSQQDSKNQATYALVLPDQLCRQLAQDVAQGQTEGKAFELFDQIAAFAGQRYYHTLYHQRHQAQKVYAFMKNDKVIQTLLDGEDQDMADQALELMARGQTRGAYQLARWCLRYLGGNETWDKPLIQLLKKLPARESMPMSLPGHPDHIIQVPLLRNRQGRPYVYPGLEDQPVFQNHRQRRPPQLLNAA